jgi:hypothetical protein
MTQDNRESWLNRVAVGMAPLFEALDAPLHRFARSRITAGWSMSRWTMIARMRAARTARRPSPFIGWPLAL